MEPCLHWHLELAPVPPGTQEVHAWLLDLTQQNVQELAGGGTEWLSKAELARASRQRNPQRRDWFVRSRVAARFLLGGFMGISPAKLVFQESAFGKPAILTTAGAPAFSWSRAGNHFLMGLARSGHLGVDLALHEPGVDVLQVAQSFFPADIAEALEAVPAKEQLRLFYAQWTRFESYAKALGCGIGATDTGWLWQHPVAGWHFWQHEFSLASGPATATLAAKFSGS